MQKLSKKLLTATILLVTSVAILLGVSTPGVKADTASNENYFEFENNKIFLTNNDILDIKVISGKLNFSNRSNQNTSFEVYQDETLSFTYFGSELILDYYGQLMTINDSDIFIVQLEEETDEIYFRNITTSVLFTEIVSMEDIVVNYNIAPAISGEHTVIANVDIPYTIERIKEIAELTAIDDYYGDITEDIVVVRDEYTSNSSKVGTYEIEFKVTNDSNLSATFVLLVSVKDLTKPVISGPGTSSISYTEEFALSNLIAKFTVTDNHDTNVKLELESTTHVPGVPGVYVYKFFAKDSSNNIATFNHTLTVVDDVKPTIIDTSEGVIRVNWRDTVTNEILLMHLTAFDAIDGDLTDYIEVIENNLTNRLGKYTVKYQVTDSAGNKGLYTRTYEVVTTDAPIFWVSANLLLISEVNALTNQQLADELASYEGINMASHMMLLNEYEGNENIPGTYMVRLAINDNKGEEHIVERTIQVFSDDELPELELSIWKKIGNFIVSVWEFIVKVFTWIWNAIKWVFNFVFGWIN